MSEEIVEVSYNEDSLRVIGVSEMHVGRQCKDWMVYEVCNNKNVFNTM